MALSIETEEKYLTYQGVMLCVCMYVCVIYIYTHTHYPHKLTHKVPHLSVTRVIPCCFVQYFLDFTASPFVFSRKQCFVQKLLICVSAL